MFATRTPHLAPRMDLFVPRTTNFSEERKDFRSGPILRNMHFMQSSQNGSYAGICRVVRKHGAPKMAKLLSGRTNDRELPRNLKEQEFLG